MKLEDFKTFRVYAEVSFKTDDDTHESQQISLTLIGGNITNNQIRHAVIQRLNRPLKEIENIIIEIE